MRPDKPAQNLSFHKALKQRRKFLNSIWHDGCMAGCERLYTNSAAPPTDSDTHVAHAVGGFFVSSEGAIDEDHCIP
jgi:hypothetical protein